MDAPKRKYQMTFTIGADTYEELLRATQQFVWFMQRELPDLDHNYNGVSGGPDSGYSFDIRVDPEMTHERYIEALNTYLDARKADRAEQGT